MELKLKFNLQDWLDNKLLQNIPFKETDPAIFNGEDFKKKCILENEEKKVLISFIEGLKKIKRDNKDVIREEYIHSRPFPFPELIEAPLIPILKGRIIKSLKTYENKEVYCLLLRNNGITVYQELIEGITSDSRDHRSVYFSCGIANGENYYFSIFRHAIMMCPPNEIQSTFEQLADEYDKLNKIDSKEKTKEKEEEIQHGFHKSLRQCDPLGNPHAEMIIWNLLNLTDLPHRVIKAVIEHVKSFNKEKV